MKQFILPSEYNGTGTAVIRGDDFHYLIRVARKREGDIFKGRDPQGSPVRITVASIKQTSCVLTIETLQPADCSPSPDNPRIVLFQCIPKGQKLDLIVRQATETGVYAIVPVESEHSVPRGGNAEAKHERRLRIARQAMQQSGSPSMPEIHGTVLFCDVPRLWERMSADYQPDESVFLFFHQEMINEDSLDKVLTKKPALTGIFIGPEGGFSEKEAATLLNSRFQPVYIRTNVLRTETAALYAIAAVQTVLNKPE